MGKSATREHEKERSRAHSRRGHQVDTSRRSHTSERMRNDPQQQISDHRSRTDRKSHIGGRQWSPRRSDEQIGDDQRRSPKRPKIDSNRDTGRADRPSRHTELNRKRLSIDDNVSPMKPSFSGGEGSRAKNDDRTRQQMKTIFGEDHTSTEKAETIEKEKPNFEPSGKLAEDTNTYKGVVIKYNEPPDAHMPKLRWCLYPFKGDEALPVLYIHRQSAYLIGRDRKIADLPVDHPSCSKQHAVLQYRLTTIDSSNGVSVKRVRPYIIDLGSPNGTFLNNERIDSQRYFELREKDVVKFGYSSREFVLLNEKSCAEESEVGVKKQESP